jgi:fructosamine-3-kinase
MEIAFTELFGRMDDRFYYAYFEQNPSEEGYELRADIYNLYPLFVHLNLFGQSYLAGIENVLARV